MSRSHALAQGLWQRLLPWLVPILLLLFWQLASVAGWLNHRVLPAPTEVLVAFWQLLSSGDLFRQVVLPGALPSILVGIRYALGIAWIILIVAETLSATSGIGYLASNAREFLQTDIVVLSILLYAALGKAVDVAARALEKRWLRWHPSYFKAA